MLSQLLENKKLEGNILFSPLSGHLALAMLLNGAEGDTKHQLKKGLGLPYEADLKQFNSEYRNILKQLKSSEHFEVEIANKAFLGRDPSDEFEEAIMNTFGGKPSILNFVRDIENARNIINQFVMEKTNGKIQNLITKRVLKPSTAFVIVNALYFKGIKLEINARVNCIVF